MVFVFVYKLQTNINKLDKKNVWLYKIIFVTYDFFSWFFTKDNNNTVVKCYLKLQTKKLIKKYRVVVTWKLNFK